MSGGPRRPIVTIIVLLTVSLFLNHVRAQSEANSSPAWRRHTIDDSSRGADGVRLADVNGDGRPDIATGWEEGGLVRVYLHPGPAAVRERWPVVTVGQVASPEDAVLVDLDGDGAVDVVSCCEGRQRTVFVHWAPRDPGEYLQPSKWTTSPLPCSNEQQWMFATPLDVDGRHGIDLAVGSKGAGGAVGLFVAPRQARNLDDWRYVRLRDAGWIMSLLAVDMDGDGDKDLLFSDRKGSRSGVMWLEHPPAEQALDPRRWREHAIGLAGQEVMFLAFDAARAGHGKRLLAATHHSRIAELRESSEGWRETTIPNPFGAPNGKGIAVGDLDLDGDLDLVHTTEPPRVESGVSWLEARAEGYLTHPISGLAGQKFDLVELVDLDGDGDLDVLTCEERDNLGVIWYENPQRAP